MQLVDYNDKYFVSTTAYMLPKFVHELSYTVL